MTLINRYVLKQLFTSFSFIAVISVLILLVFDFMDNNDVFIRKQIPLNTIIYGYYLYLIPYVFNMVMPLCIFITTIYVTSRMSGYSEITAVFSAGYSTIKLFIPYFIFSSILAVITFMLSGWIIPEANKRRINFEYTFMKPKISFVDKDVHLLIAPDTYVYLQSYNSNSNVGKNFTLEHVTGNRLLSKLSGDSLIWCPHKRCWLLSDYSYRSFDAGGETFVSGKNKELIINLSPDDFEYKFWLHKELSITELNEHINLLQKEGKGNPTVFRTELYQLCAYPFIMVIITVMGFLVSYNKSTTSFKVAVAFLLSFILISLSLFFHSLSEFGNVHPLLSIISINVLFVSICIGVYKWGI